MLLDWLLPVAIVLELGFSFWHLVMIVTLLRDVLSDGDNGLTLSMAFLSISSFLLSLWIVVALATLPIEFIIVKIPMDIFRAVIVTLFMWELDLGERYNQWRNRR